MVLLQASFEPINLVAAVVITLISTILYKIYLNPLAHIPGPLIARLTPLWLYSLSYRGIEASTVDDLHKRFGPVVQIAPNEVDIADGASLHLIYVKNGGLLKSSCYKNFDINGFPSLFSALDPTHRATRAKAVIGMFSQTAVREGKDLLSERVDLMVARLKREKADADGKPVDVLNIFRGLALDMATLYLFGKTYNGIEEEKLSATGFVDNFVGAGRFFYLPNRIYKIVEFVATSLDIHKKLDISWSNNMVEKFAANVVVDTAAAAAATLGGKAEEETYQARLLNAGISQEETISQCLDVMFAGTDAVGMNLSVICYYLSRNPNKYDRLRKEILDNQSAAADVQTLPYFSGVIKEGLRLAMANPTRLSRIVSSPNGLKLQGLLPSIPSITIPAGTNVGISAYTLHFNPKVFPNPYDFLPERWLEPNVTPEMLRDSIAFGIGPRQCIARNLATAGLFWAVEGLVKGEVLKGARPVVKKDRIEIFEWFNARVKDRKVELVW